MIRWRGNQLKVYPNISIEPKNWNSKTHRVKYTHPLSSVINQRLNSIEIGVQKKYYMFLNENDKEPTLVQMKEILSSEDNQFFFKYIEKFIIRQKDKVGALILKKYKNVNNKLQEYCNDDLKFDDITLNWFYGFEKWMLDKNLATNTMQKILATLKTFLNAATDDDINKCFDYKKKGFSIKKENTTSVYLSVSELKLIENVQLPDHLERVRDLFLVGAFTGLRFSDFSTLTLENVKLIDNVKCIEKFTQKTNQNVIIPINPIVEKILEKYQGFPPAISNQKTNKALKIIGEKAGICEIVQKSITKGGKRIISSHKKFELISTHTARRSFATNSYLSGVPTIAIMKITGHTTETSFMKYIRVSKRQNAIQMSEFDFFK